MQKFHVVFRGGLRSVTVTAANAFAAESQVRAWSPDYSINFWYLLSEEQIAAQGGTL
jgi:hypothetical protein